MAMERIYVTEPRMILKAGHQGENLARCICFPLTSLAEQYGEGTWTIVFRRPFESDPYVVANQEEVGEYAVWGLDATDTAVCGEGRVELRYYVDDTLCKTDVYAVSLLPSLGTTGDAPSPYEDIIDAVAGYAAEARDAVASVPETVAELQAELDEAISGATVDSEVINARVDADGTTYGTLKQRLDAENTELKNQIGDNASDNIFDNYIPVTGKYYDGTERTAASYNYYVVPVLKGVKYMVLPKMRMHVIKVGSTNVVIDTTDKKTSFTPTVDGVAYITVYAADTPMLFIANTDKTFSIDGKAADAKATGDTLFKVENYCKDYNLTRFASSHILDKYYSTNGSIGTSSTYNYYAKIPVVSGNTYLFTGRGARYCVLYNNNAIVQTAESISVFTANYDGDLYVTEYASAPISMYIYNDFYKLNSWTNNNINSKALTTGTSMTFDFITNAGDKCHLKLNGYSGEYFYNCLLYVVQDGGNTIVASLYSDTGEYVFIAPNATRYMIYINRSQSETATLNFELTNLNKNTIFNSIERHNIINRFMSHIYGKKIACLGDSFTYGVDTYVAKLNKRYLSHAINYGVASSRIVLDTTSGGTTIESFLNRYSAMDDTADIITVFGGINDSYDLGSGALTLGTIESALDTTTFYGGLKLLITNLMKKYPDKQIIGIVPPDCQTGAYYIANLPAVQNAEREVYNMYGIPIIDIKRECYKMSTLDEMVALYRAAIDNIHPSNAGQEALCDTIAAGIRRIIT